MKKRISFVAAVCLCGVGAILATAAPARAQGPKVTVVNPTSQPVPVEVVGTPTVNVTGGLTLTGTPTVNANVTGEVAIAGTPSVNANVSGSVGIVGTPTVDVRSMPGVNPAAFFVTCAFSGSFCQSQTIQQAPAGYAFHIDSIQGRTFGSGTPDVAATLTLGIVTPGLSAGFEVQCPNFLGFARCNATPGITVTEFEGASFFGANVPPGAAATVIVYYTLVKLGS
jgi:hypothetical protein